MRKKTDINEIIETINQLKTKQERKEYLADFDNLEYIIYRLFSEQDEQFLKKLPNTLYNDRICSLIYCMLGTKAEDFYPAKMKGSTNYYKENEYHFQKKSLIYKNKMYYEPVYIESMKRSRYCFSNSYDSFFKWYESAGDNIKGYILDKAKIPKTGIENIDFTGVYVSEKDHLRLKGSIPVVKTIINKQYHKGNNTFTATYGYVADGSIIRDGETYTYGTFKEFAKAMKNDLSGGDYTGFNFRNIKKKDYNIENTIASQKVKKQDEIISDIVVNEIRNHSLQLLENNKRSLTSYHEEEYGHFCLYYISDLHIDHKITEKINNDEQLERFLIKKIKEMKETIEGSNNTYFYSPLLIMGDITFSYELNKMFFSLLRRYIYRDIIVVLGNHELWSENYKEQIKRYELLFKDLGIILLNNSMYTINGCGNYEKCLYTSADLLKLTEEELRNNVKKSIITFFGGTGFAGLNEQFNADNGIYRDAMTREQEIEESNKISLLYSKLSDAIGDYNNVMVVTHMPPKDWLSGNLNPNWVHFHGHDHRNAYVYNDNYKIIADNQIGYKNRRFTLNRYMFDGYYDIFKDYKDGIYEITPQEYKDFCVGKSIIMQYTSEKPVMMLKKNNVYLFMRKGVNGYHLLNGGMPNKVDHHPDYYFERMDEEARMIMKPLTLFTNYQKQYADFVRSFGGSGFIHGCIIDIDFLNHLYVNPQDGKVTPYYATSIINKYVYTNIKSLIAEKRPDLLANYEKSEKHLPDIISESSKLEKAPFFSTDIYNMSRKLKSMQYLQNVGVIRCWYELNTDPYKILEDNEKYLADQ